MPEFCVMCNHDRRDHFDDGACTVEVSRLRHRLSRRRVIPEWRWEPCPCTAHTPEETS